MQNTMKNKSIHKFKNGPVKNEERRVKLLNDKIRPLDLERASTLSNLVDAWAGCGIQSRNLAQCAGIYEQMLTDPSRPTVLIGLSGALIAGGMRKVLSDMIKAGIVDVVVSTGAILYQDYYTACGYSHYIGAPDANDAALHSLYINRIYDSYVDEIGFVKCDDSIAEFCNSLEPRGYSTREFFNLLGASLGDEGSILYNAYKHGVPVFCPAIADSSIGIGMALSYRKARENDIPKMAIDTIRDNYEIGQIVLKSKRTGAVYVGGGVPKNYINDAAVMFDYTKGHSYAIQITADSPQWGGLSGSTLDEAKSWGKVSTQACRATVFGEATIVLPLVVGSLLQKGVHKGRPRLDFVWQHDKLCSIGKEMPDSMQQKLAVSKGEAPTSLLGGGASLVDLESRIGVVGKDG